MVKKYELIKKYPGSAELGTLATEQDSGYKIKSTIFSRKSVEEYPEFWKKLPSDDYHVISIFDTDFNKIINIQKDGKFCQGELRSLKFGSRIRDEILYDDNSEINSIERISDEKIFKIGDVFEHPCGGLIKVRRFILSNHSDLEVIFEDFGVDNNDEVHLFNIDIFDTLTRLWVMKSRDEVALYHGDVAYSVDEKTMKIKEINIDSESPSKYNLIFQAKINANEYVSNNKKRYSKVDIETVLRGVNEGRINQKFITRVMELF